MPDKLKKSAGLSPLLIPRVWALALPLEQNKQCRGPRFMIYIKLCIPNHGRRTLRYCGSIENLRDSNTPQINAVTTSFLYVLSRTRSLEALGV